MLMSPISPTYSLTLASDGGHKTNPHTPCRAKPVVPGSLAAIASVVDADNSLHVATYACCLLLFHILAIGIGATCS